MEDYWTTRSYLGKHSLDILRVRKHLGRIGSNALIVICRSSEWPGVNPDFSENIIQKKHLHIDPCFASWARPWMNCVRIQRSIDERCDRNGEDGAVTAWPIPLCHFEAHLLSGLYRFHNLRYDTRPEEKKCWKLMRRWWFVNVDCELPINHHL